LNGEEPKRTETNKYRWDQRPTGGIGLRSVRKEGRGGWGTTKKLWKEKNGRHTDEGAPIVVVGRK